MKTIFKYLLLTIILFSTSTISKAEVDILVLPTDLYQAKSNSYYFEEASIIFANDIISDFQQNKNLNSPNLSEVYRITSKSKSLKSITENTLKNYRNNEIDYEEISKIAKKFKCDKVLLITSYIANSKGENRRNIWEVLEVSSAVKIPQKYVLSTKAILIDTTKNLIVFNEKHEETLSDIENIFYADELINGEKYLDNLEKYSKCLLSKNISQNINLLLFPKRIQPITKKEIKNSMSPLEYQRNLRENRPDNDLEKNDDEIGEIIYSY
ncbi:MAG: hypothetical protein R3Y28_01605 [Candidatus Gastranaerophilales bacterium]